MGPRPHLSFWACKTTWLTSELLVSMGPSLHLWILHAKQRLLDQNYKSIWVPALICGFCMQNSDFWIRITSLYGSQPSSVVFACKTATLASESLVSMGPRPHLWFFEFKTAPLAAELQVSMGPSPHLWFYAFTTATLWPELIVSMGPRPHLSFWACKTTWLTSEILVSMGPSLHLWILHAKQRLLDRNYKSLWVPAITCGFCMQNSDFWIRITSLYGSQPSSVVFACKTATLASELLVSMCLRPNLWFFAFKTATLAAELQVSMGPRPHLRFLHCKTATFGSEFQVSMVPSHHLWFCSKNSYFIIGITSLYVSPALICGFCMQNSDFRTRNTSLYGSLTSPIFFAFKRATLASELLVSMGPSLHLCFFLHSKQRL